MGTRGFIGLVVDEQQKITYNHFDSYPGGVGAQVLAYLRDATKDMAKLTEQARALKMVDEDTPPTEDEQLALLKHFNAGVSTGRTAEWYALLRDTQGDLGATLECGYAPDASGFPFDSLFCEWGYLADLDRGVFEVYRGFQQGKRPTKGLWAGLPTDEDIEKDLAELDKTHPDYAAMKRASHQAGEYYMAVECMASWPLTDLPSDEDFTVGTMEADED